MLDHFIQYIFVLNNVRLSYDQDAAQEVQDRLWQSEYALAQLDDCISRYVASEQSDSSDIDAFSRNYLSASNELFSKGKFYAESYYYFAFRIYKLCTHKSKSLPHLQTFSCPGVLAARNHLIEHPEGHSSNATAYSYSFCRTRGAFLRTSRSAEQKIHDKGSVFNQSEFRNNFINTVQGAVRAIQNRA